MPKDKQHKIGDAQTAGAKKTLQKANPPDNELIEKISNYITRGQYVRLKLYLQSLNKPLSEEVVLNKFVLDTNLLIFAFLFGHDLFFAVMRLTPQSVFDKACTTFVIDNDITLLQLIFAIAREDKSVGANIKAEIILDRASSKAIGIGAQIQSVGAGNSTALYAAFICRNEKLLCLFLQKIFPDDLNRAVELVHANTLNNILHLVISLNFSQYLIDLLMHKLDKRLVIKFLAMKNLRGAIPFDYALPANEMLYLETPPARAFLDNRAAEHVLKHIDVNEWQGIISQSIYGQAGFMRKIKLYNTLFFNQLREMQIATRTLREGALDENDLGAEVQASSVENLRFLVAANPDVMRSVIKPEYPQYSLTGINSIRNPIERWRGQQEISSKLERAFKANQIESAVLREVYSFFAQYIHQFPYEIVLLIFSYQVKPFMIELTTPSLPIYTSSPVTAVMRTQGVFKDLMTLPGERAVNSAKSLP